MIKKKFKIFHKVLSFIQLSKSNSVSHSRDQELFDSQTASPIYDPANLDLPERNFEEFEKITDLSQVQQRPTLFNQMSIDVQTPVAYSPKSSNKNEEGFMIRVSQIKNKNGENENTEEASETSSIQPIEEEEDESELDEEEQENEEQSEAPEKQEDLNIPGALKEEKEELRKQPTEENEEQNQSFDMDFYMDSIENKNKSGENAKLRSLKQYRDYPFFIYPDDTFKNIWAIVLSVFLSYTCIVLPYRVAFEIDPQDEEIFSGIDWLTDAIFMVDVILNFFSPYYDTEDNLIISRKKIMGNYLAGWFLADTIGIIPFDLIFETNRYGNLIRIVRLPKLLRFIKMTKFIRILKLVKERNKIFGLLMEVLQIGAGFERLFKSVVSILLFCHIASCIWFLTANLNDGEKTWVNEFQFNNSTNFEIYISSYYWITQTVVTVGYGDISPQNTVERFLACVFMLVGVFFYSYTIGSLSSLLSNLDSKNASYDQRLNTLLQIRNQYNIDVGLYNRVKKSLKYGQMQNGDKKLKFLNDLPLNLRVELSVTMHRNIFSGIEFFKNKGQNFLATIGPVLKVIYIGQDEYIFNEEEYADEMYFLKQGVVQIVLKEFNNFQFIRIEPGYYFGEVDLLFGETHKYTHLAHSDVELLALSKKDFNRIFFHEFREIGSELYKNALKRKVRYDKRYKEAFDYCNKKQLQSKARLSFQFRSQLSYGQKPGANSRRDSDLFKSEIESAELKPNDSHKEIEESPEKPLNVSFPERNDGEHEQLTIPPLPNILENKGILNRFSGSFAKSQFGQALLNATGKKTAGEEKLDEFDSKLTKMEKDMNEILETYKSMGICQEDEGNKGGLKGNGKNKLKKIKNLGKFVRRASRSITMQPKVIETEDQQEQPKES